MTARIIGSQLPEEVRRHLARAVMAQYFTNDRYYTPGEKAMMAERWAEYHVIGEYGASAHDCVIATRGLYDRLIEVML